MKTKSPKQLVLVVGAIISVFSFLLYLFTLPNANTGLADSDEIITVSYTLGVAHPPSYPLYTILGKIFTLIPLPLSIAGRVNLLNSLLHSLSIFFLFLTATLIFNKFFKRKIEVIIFSAFTSLLVTFSITFWLFSIITEVFSLNTFFVSLLLFLLFYLTSLDTIRNRQFIDRLLLASAFIFGLALSNQQIIILLAPVFLLILFFFQPSILKNLKLLGLCIFLSALGFLLPYIYLPLASAANPHIDWNHPVTYQAVFQNITRQFFGDINPSGKAYLGGNFTVAKSIYGSIFFLGFLVDNFITPLLLLSILGLLFLITKRQFKLLSILLLGVLAGGYFFSLYANYPAQSPDNVYQIMSQGVHQRFYLSSLLFVSILISLGAAYVYQISQKISFKLSYLILTITFLYLFKVGYYHFLEIDKTNLTIAHTFGREVLESLEQDSILFCVTEQGCFTSLYMQLVEGVRPDIIIGPTNFVMNPPSAFKQRYPDLIKTTFPYTTTHDSFAYVRDIIRTNLDKHPLYTIGMTNYLNNLSVYGIDGNPFYLIPNGCTFQISTTWKESKAAFCNTSFQEATGSYISPKLPLAQMIPSHLSYNLFYAGYLHYQHDCVDTAIGHVTKSLQLSSQYSHAKTLLLKLSQSDPNSRCQTVPPVIPDTLIEQADNEIKKNNLPQGLKLLNQVVMLEPENINLRIKLAQIYLANGNQKMAYYELLDVLQIDPYNQSAKVLLDRINPGSFN